ncbi:MAG: polysaccharide deacetylase family protein [Candidatus Omnitrophica bacterium]|nr:polysaccharide deacetylase family protein [Candidatus Omnitrophota bacterium]
MKKKLDNKILKLFIFITLTVLSTSKSYAGLDREHNITGLVYYHGDKNQAKVALTFDDGPNEPYTSEIMDILKKYNVKATFFVLGKNVERYPDTVKRIVKEGHIIGNHTYDHPYLLIQSKAHVKYEIERTEEAIFKATGIKPYLFRPPYGLSSNWLYRAVQGWGYVSVEWSVTGNNGGKEIRPDTIEKDILSRVTNGAIILLHDGNRLIKGADRSHVVKALPVIIESLRAKGYQLVTVPELLGLEQPSLDKKRI